MSDSLQQHVDLGQRMSDSTKTDITINTKNDAIIETKTDVMIDTKTVTDLELKSRTKKNKTKVRFAKDNNSTKENKFKTEHIFIPNRKLGTKLNYAQLCSSHEHEHDHKINTKAKTPITDSNDLEDKKVDIVFNMFNSFLKLYNTKHQTVGCIFENINLKDPQSTNDKLEMFYEYMQEHKSLEAENPSYVDVYDLCSIDENNDQSNNHNDIYALIVDDDKIKYTSLSYISLLKVGAQDQKLAKKRWNIIKLT